MSNKALTFEDLTKVPKNRLIVIGNGFDLAHGYKTSYTDFMGWLLVKALKSFLDAWQKERLNSIKGDAIFFETQDQDMIWTVLNRFLDRNSEPSFADVKKFIFGNKSLFRVKFGNNLISDLYSHLSNQNWVDVEETYFAHIKSIVQRRNGSPFTSTDRENVQKLNKEMQFLTEELEAYLTEVVPTNQALRSMFRLFASPDYNSTIILNFNYTLTFHNYINFKEHQYEIINIHGELNSELNPIIFGAGDEEHSLFPDIKEANIDEMLHNIKSNKYLVTDNYTRLMRLVHGGYDFDVDVIGHSCGISDRTLLRTVFNAEKCKKVYIYHHRGQESFKNSTYGISRYFNSSSLMMEKVQPYNKELTIPQLES